MVSSLTESGSRITLDSLAAGAVDFVCKPSGNLKEGLMHMMTELSAKIKTASAVNVSHYRNNGSKAAAEIKTKVGDFYSKKDVIIAIGASTGGTEAISKIITTLPKSTPGIVIVQHMPEKFTKMFASRLNNESDLDIKEAESGDSVERGKVLIAPGGRHIQIFKSDNDYKVVCRDGDTVCGHKPSVDVLFRSMARYVKDRAIGIMLTGMGSDGADAMYKMREAGARTIAQDRKTSVVFGMPKEAHERGGVEFLMPLDRIAEKIKMLAEETK
jgi:two-component system chemotaxis response regulator CheB